MLIFWTNILNKKAKINSEVKVSVSANGKRVGEPISFRVKRIPDPDGKINGMKKGKMSRGALVSAPGISAGLDNFPFDIRYTVISYKVVLKDGDYQKTISVPKGYQFTDEIKKKIKKQKPGSDIVFKEIKVKGPDGKKDCKPIIFTLQ